MEVQPIIFVLLMLPSVILLIVLRKYGLALGLVIYLSSTMRYDLLTLAATVTLVTGYGIFLYTIQPTSAERVDLTINNEE